MLGFLRSWCRRQSLVFSLHFNSPRRNRKLTRMKNKKTNPLASCKTTHLPAHCLYLELFFLSCSACSEQSGQYSPLAEQKKFPAAHLKPTVTRCNYTAVCPLRHNHTQYTHTPFVLYTPPAHTISTHTVRTVRTHRAHAHCAHHTRTLRAPYAHPARPSRTRAVGYKSKPCFHHSWI